MAGPWTVEVVGIVSRLDGKARVAVPRGAYLMREIGFEEYELSRDGGPIFPLTLIEVVTYTRKRDLKVIQPPSWP